MFTSAIQPSTSALKCEIQFSILPFPTYNTSAADDFENIYSKYGNSMFMKEQLLNKVKNILANGEIAYPRLFLLLPQ